MDLTAILLIACLVAGAVVLADVFYLRPRRMAASSPGSRAEPIAVAYARSFLPVIFIVLVVRSFVFEPFRIPSPSMMPTLVDGDFVFVTKFSYGLRLPLLNTKVLSTGEPRRGDVIVFRLPADPSIRYIKRLIGLPGDRIVVRNNRLTINGSAVPLAPGGVYAGGEGFTGSELAAEQFGQVGHVVMFDTGRPSTDFEATVPAGRYFFMGDNRNDSQDSRFPQVGFVPEENLIGHAVRIWMNWNFPEWPLWNRIGKRIV
jgi:signal peptidase I